MAATDARALALKNTAFRATFPILDADGDLVTAAASLDSEVSKDGGTFADCTNEATEIATSSGMYYLDLTSTEMNADTVAVIVKTSTSGAKTTPMVWYPAEDADIRANVVNWNGSAPNNLQSGRVDSYVGAFASAVINAASIASDAITSAKIADGALTAAKFASGAFDAVWTVTTRTLSAFGFSVTVSDKTGFSLSSAGIQAIWDALTSALTTANSIGKLLVDNINATISSRLATAGYTAPPSAASVADAVWDEPLGDHLGAGSTGNALNAAGAAGDPWSTSLPGAYGAGSAGKIIGDNINATISSRLASASYTAPLDAAGTRSAVGLASANLDTQLAAIAGFVDTEVAAILAAVDTEVAAIKAKTDNLPSDPADASDIASSFTTVNTKLDTIDDFLDTEIAAIKAKTDNLPDGGALTTIQSDLDNIQTRLPAALINGHIDNGEIIHSGTSQSPGAGVGNRIKLASGANGNYSNYYKYCILRIDTDPTEGATNLAGLTGIITAYDESSKVANFVTGYTDFDIAVPTGCTYSIFAGVPMYLHSLLGNAQGDVRTALGMAAADLDSQLTAIADDVWGHTSRTLTAAGIDAILVESGISASSALTDDAGTQLTSINGRQALAVILSAVAGVLAGADPGVNPLTIKPGGKPSGNTRLSRTGDDNGNRSAMVLKVPT